MLKAIDNLSEKTPQSLTSFFGERLSDVYVLFSMLDYKGVDGAWLQTEGDEVTALVVKRDMSKVYVCAKDNADLYEVAEFISGLGGVVVHCSSEITARIGVTAFSKLSLMELQKTDDSNKTAVSINKDLRPVFDLLIKSKQNILKNSIDEKNIKKQSDRAYKEWLNNITRGISGGYTEIKAVKVGENSILSAAVAQRLSGNVFFCDIAIDGDYHKMGYGADCITALCNDYFKSGEKVFLACGDIKSENFYRKSGFERKEYLELGIVEL